MLFARCRRQHRLLFYNSPPMLISNGPPPLGTRDFRLARLSRRDQSGLTLPADRRRRVDAYRLGDYPQGTRRSRLIRSESPGFAPETNPACPHLQFSRNEGPDSREILADDLDNSQPGLIVIRPSGRRTCWSRRARPARMAPGRRLSFDSAAKRGLLRWDCLEFQAKRHSG